MARARHHEGYSINQNYQAQSPLQTGQGGFMRCSDMGETFLFLGSALAGSPSLDFLKPVTGS